MKALESLRSGIVGILFGTFLALVLAEVALRLFPQLMPVPAQLRHHTRGDVKIDKDVRVPDSHLGYRLPPGLDTLLEAYPEPPYRVRTIDLGYGDTGFRSAPRSGGPAAVVVGDSFTFAEGVSEAEAWPNLLAERTGWNVLNLGLNGYGPPQYTRMLVRYGLPLHPKLVLWAFCPNDLGNAYDFHAWLEEGHGDFRSSSSLRRPGLSGLYKHMWSGLREHSFAFDALAFAIRAWKRGAAATVAKGDIAFSVQWDYWQPLVALDDEPIRRGWEWTQEDLLQARDAARAAGAELVVVLVPFREQVYWNLLEGSIDDWAHQKPDGPTDLVRSFCAERGIRVLDLAPPFRRLAERGRQLYFAGDGHWNPAGNELAAETIAQYLRAEGLLPASALNGR